MAASSWLSRDSRQGASEPVRDRAVAAPLDAEGDDQVELGFPDDDGAAKQRMKRVEVVGERNGHFVVGEPGEHAFIALVELLTGAPDPQPSCDLLDQAFLHLGRERGSDLGVVGDASNDQRSLGALALGPQGIEIG